MILRFLLFFSSFFIFLFIAISCNKKISTASGFITSNDVENIEPMDNKRNNCNDWQNYVPSSNLAHHEMVRNIRVNFHIVQRADGTGNFDKNLGRQYVKNIINYSNGMLASGNKPMNLPTGNNTPVLPTNYRYVLTPDPSIKNDDGIYFHRDEELYFMTNSGKDRNLTKRDVINKYAVQEEDVLNIFLLAHHADSLKSKTYKAYSRGIALGSSVKIVGLFYNYWYSDPNVNPPEYFKREWLERGLLDHEIGHVLGLGHSWVTNDRCDDTPSHRNCWNFGAPPCNVVSNNVMDYNTYRDAWTPCQLGIVHKNFAKKNSKQRKLLQKNWCHLDTSKNVKIRRTSIWDGAKDLAGHIMIGEKGELTINCRISLPKGGKITIKPGGKLIIGEYATLENDCGEQWEGIVVEEKNGTKGQVTIIGKPTFTHMKHPFSKESL